MRQAAQGLLQRKTRIVLMKRISCIAILTSILIMMMSVLCFAGEGDLKLVSSYPEDGQKNTSIENLGVKLTFNNALNSKENLKANKARFKILDENGKAIPVQVLFSNDEDGLVLVLADQDQGFTAANNAEYVLTIDGDLVDNNGNTLGKDQTVTFKTYNQKVNNMVNMIMMTAMFGGIMVVSMRQNNLKKEEEEDQKEEPKEAFNPYKEAKKTGKTVDEVIAEHEKEEEKKAKRKARKNKKKQTEVPETKKIENCAQYLNNVYHVHAPAPISKEDRSVEALKAMRKEGKSGKTNSKK